MADFPQRAGAVSVFTDVNFHMDAKHSFVLQKGAMTASRTVTLQPMTEVAPGKMVAVLDVSGSVSKAMPLVVQAAPGELINGTTSLTLISPYGSVLLITLGDGRWSVLSVFGDTQ